MLLSKYELDAVVGSILIVFVPYGVILGCFFGSHGVPGGSLGLHSECFLGLRGPWGSMLASKSGLWGPRVPLGRLVVPGGVQGGYITPPHFQFILGSFWKQEASKN